MLNLIFSPHEAIDACKKQKGYGNAWTKLLFGAAIMGMWGLVMGLTMLGMTFVNSLMVLAAVLLIVIVGNIFNAWIYKIVINTLSGKGNYEHTFTALANSLVIMSIGLLIATLLWLIPTAGIILATFVLIIFMLMAYSVMIRTIMVMSGADLLTVFVGLVLVLFSSIAASLIINALTVVSLGLAGMATL